jgi:hypothetical protein
MRIVEEEEVLDLLAEICVLAHPSRKESATGQPGPVLVLGTEGRGHEGQAILVVLERVVCGHGERASIGLLRERRLWSM